MVTVCWKKSRIKLSVNKCADILCDLASNYHHIADIECNTYLSLEKLMLTIYIGVSHSDYKEDLSSLSRTAKKSSV